MSNTGVIVIIAVGAIRTVGGGEDRGAGGDHGEMVHDADLAEGGAEQEGVHDHLVVNPTFSTGDASGWKGPWNQGWAVEGLHYMAGCGC